MQLIDTHTHFYLPEFDTDRDEAVKRAVQAGVTKMLMPNINIQSVGMMISAENRYSGTCFSMIGLHPTSVREDYLSQIEKLEALADGHKFIAIGEIGIDLYWNQTFLTEQIAAFRRQIAFALRKGLPVVIHSRESFPEVFSVTDEFDGENLKGVFHAFSGNEKDADKAIKMGFMLGIGGTVTFKNSGLKRIVEAAGPQHLILETDSPYLAPVPYRGTRNESSYLYLINKKLSDILGMDEEEVASVTFANSLRLFNL